MTFPEQYVKQIELADWIDKTFKIRLPTDTNRQLFSISCFDLAIEHHASICLLLNAQLYGSAFALLRLAYEALVRGLFLSLCATEDEINAYDKDSFGLKFNDMIIRIEGHLSIQDSGLSSLKNTSWKIFNSFTHSGIAQVIRRNKDGVTGNINYPEQELIQVLSLAGVFALWSVSQFAAMSENQLLIDAVINKNREYAAKNK